MSDDMELVTRLRGADPDRVSPMDALRLHDNDPTTFPLAPEDIEGVLDLVDEAADVIERQAGEIERLREALEPFADFVPDFFDDGYQDDDIVRLTSHHGDLDLTLTVEDFRRARTSTQGGGEK